MNFRIRFLVILFIAALQSCSGPYYLKNSQASQTHIKQDSLKLVDTVVLKMIAPYKMKLDSQMNEVISVSDVDLLKERPEGTLCNLFADAILAYGNKVHDKPVDICILNYGGIRVSSIAKGNITLGKAYEIMPFDNMLEVIEIPGDQLKQLLTVVAQNGGWPVSGMRMKIADSKAEDIFIGGQPINGSKNYLLITSDYIANGGDNVTILQHLKRTALNYKIRDALIDYLRDHKANNKNINLVKDGRIIAN
ncbi:MAG: 5'-nucleotidase C-terminal domain-containing protein [Bacteroidia bacterium]